MKRKTKKWKQLKELKKENKWEMEEKKIKRHVEREEKIRAIESEDKGNEMRKFKWVKAERNKENQFENKQLFEREEKLKAKHFKRNDDKIINQI